MKRLAPLTLLATALCAAPLSADDGVLRYTQTNGAGSSTFEVEVSRSTEGMKVRSEGAGRSEESLWVPGRGLISWRHSEPAAASDLRAERTGNMIRVTGRLKGRDVTRDLRVDAAPWYQIFGPGIADLLPTGAGRMEFWVLNPDDLSTHKMLAQQAGTERREIDGAEVDTFKVHFSPAGALALFWGADFWYRPSDSAWLFSRLPENGRSTTTTIIW
jgi:hypothetical protein